MLALLLAVSLAACGRSASQETDASAPIGVATEAPAQENTEETVTADEGGLLALEEIPEEYLEGVCSAVSHRSGSEPGGMQSVFPAERTPGSAGER